MYLIGIAGGSGSGKTTFSEKILHQVGEEQVGVLHMDAYYLPDPPESHYTKKGKPNYDHPAAFDWNLLKGHLEMLKNGQSIDMPTYDFHSNKRLSNTNSLGPFKVVIIEGIFSLYDPHIRDLLDIKVFLHVEADMRFTRRLHRDVQERGRSLESVIEQYYETVRPMYQKYLDPQRQFADFIVGEKTEVSSNLLTAKIQEVIQKRRLEKEASIAPLNENVTSIKRPIHEVR